MLTDFRPFPANNITCSINPDRLDSCRGYQGSVLLSSWAPTIKRLGIRYRRPYNMRHTYATLMLMAGMTPAFCARQLGHSIEMFLRTYSKWLDGTQNDMEMARFEAAINRDLPKICPKENKKGA